MPSTAEHSSSNVYDFVIVGSGFGGSVCAMRLAERGHRVLVLERGKRFRDDEFARSTWDVRRYLWMPPLRCFGILEIRPFRDLSVLAGCGVGGGSLGYANVLMEPSDALYQAPGWRALADWRTVLAPHFATAKRMLGVAPNPRPRQSDAVLRDVAADLGGSAAVSPAEVGAYFGEVGQEGVTVPDPYFGGAGPERASCIHCGACMVGCRHNAKNTLPKNYLYFAERLGAEVRAECEVRDITPVADGDHAARYAVRVRSSTSVGWRKESVIRTNQVIVSAGALGTMRLLFRCRDVTRSLPKLSGRLGYAVRTNSETILGSVSRDPSIDFSRGHSITSVLRVDAETTVQAVQYPAGSSMMRLLNAPLTSGATTMTRAASFVGGIIRHPIDFLRMYVLPGWAEHTTMLLVMQTLDNRVRLRLGRGLFTGFRRGLVSEPDATGTARTSSRVGRDVAERYAALTDGFVIGSTTEALLGTSITAHILGGCPMGVDASDGVVGADCGVHGYPGLYVVDGSIMPGNPGINPSLTITALAEYAAERIATLTPRAH